MSKSLRNVIMGAAILCAAAGPAAAEEAWVATHNLMPGDILRADDMQSQSLAQPAPDALPATRDLTGLEVKRRVYLGHPLGARDVGAPIVVKANAAVDVYWQAGDLTLVMQGNALEPGAVGDSIRVLNPTTERAVRGIVTAQGTVEIRSEQ